LSDEISSQPGRISVRGRHVMIGCGQGSIVPQEIEVESRTMEKTDLYDFMNIHAGELMA
jgi:hypothetical protein